jgi:hypothetical protein
MIQVMYLLVKSFTFTVVKLPRQSEVQAAVHAEAAKFLPDLQNTVESWILSSRYKGMLFPLHERLKLSHLIGVSLINMIFFTLINGVLN